MKNLKIKSTIGVVIFATLFLVSCQEKIEISEPQTVEFNIEDVEHRFYFALPAEYENASTEEIQEFLDTIDEQTLLELEVSSDQVSSRYWWGCSQVPYSCNISNWCKQQSGNSFPYMRLFQDTCSGLLTSACMSNCNIY